ncbi:Uncharacterized protein HZ326_11914 [Fusarium oxysporum f. sp. albedinis]|nr:Uncharacterized protein HZ326_11914 [Fusarium oxysporum f. sp. albedinis]
MFRESRQTGRWKIIKLHVSSFTHCGLISPGPKPSQRIVHQNEILWQYFLWGVSCDEHDCSHIWTSRSGRKHARYSSGKVTGCFCRDLCPLAGFYRPIVLVVLKSTRTTTSCSKSTDGEQSVGDK